MAGNTRSDADSTSRNGFPFIAAAVALVFIMVGGAVAWGARQCGNTDFSISMQNGLTLKCNRTPSPPPIGHELGYIYYGRKKSDGQPSDNGKLRPANNAFLPYPHDIKAGDVFTATDIKQFRVGSDTNSQTKEMKAGTCFSTVRVTRFISDDQADGAWLEVQTTPCPA